MIYPAKGEPLTVLGNVQHNNNRTNIRGQYETNQLFSIILDIVYQMNLEYLAEFGCYIKTNYVT